FPAEETTAERGYVPHFLPGQNELLDEFAAKYSVPRWVVSAGAATMYPDFAQRIEARNARAIEPPPAPVAPERVAAADGIRSMHVKGKVWAIFGAGGNVIVQIGDEGVLVVDAGSAEKAAEVRAEIARLSGGKPIRYVISTHFHSDHTGGNVLLANEPIQRAAVLAP